MPTIHLDLAFSPLIVLLLAAAGFVTAFWFYRFTIPVVSRPLRVLLATLRGSALALLLLLLAQPLLRLTTSSTRPPVLAVLLDNSLSMQVADRGGSLRRIDRAREALGSTAFAPIAARGEIRFFSFGTALRPLAGAADTSMPPEEGTDLSAALQGVAREREKGSLDAVLLLSDGMATRGRNPLYDAGAPGVPLYAVAFGDTAEPRDLAIVRINANRIVYDGVATPVDVVVRSSGLRSDERVQVVLSDGTRELARETILPGSLPAEQRVTLTYTPAGPGTRRYTVQVDRLPGEQTVLNNRSAFVARVLRSRVRILLIAGTPGPDVSAIGQTLREEPEYSVTNLTQRGNGAFIEGELAGARLDSADAVILLGYPTPATGAASWELLRTALRQRPLPVMIILGKGTDPRRLAELSPRVPFSLETYSVTEQYVTALPVEKERLHPLVALGSEDGIALWRRLPPLFRTTSIARAQPGSTTLVTAAMAGQSGPDPLVVLRSVGGQRSIGVTGYGLWRWRLMVQGDDRARNVLGDLLSAAMKWLTSPDDAKPVRLRVLEEIVAPGEQIGIAGEVYDAASRPVDAARFVVTLKRPEGDLVTELRPLGSGRYEGAVEGLPEGEYRITGSAELDGTPLGSDEAKVLIGGTSAEMRDTRPDHGTLRALAARTGGCVVSPEGFSRLDSALGVQPGFAARRVERSEEFRLQAWPVVLVLLLLFLAAEWILRRRAGML
jgi:hypothetical protein